MWNAALGACCSRNGVFSGQGGEGSGWTSLFLTGVDEERRQQPISAGYVIAHVFTTSGHLASMGKTSLCIERIGVLSKKSAAYSGRTKWILGDPRNS